MAVLAAFVAPACDACRRTPPFTNQGPRRGLSVRISTHRKLRSFSKQATLQLLPRQSGRAVAREASAASAAAAGKHPDVVVVGAGIAGLNCAAKLRAAGLDVLVLEASDGVGGRVRTDEVRGNPAPPLQLPELPSLYFINYCPLGSGGGIQAGPRLSDLPDRVPRGTGTGWGGRGQPTCPADCDASDATAPAAAQMLS